MRKLLYLTTLAMLAMLILAPAAIAQSRGPSGADGTYNCEDFDFQEDAQAFFDSDPSDPDGLDGPVGDAFTGEPGVACEELPSNGETGVEMMEETTPDSSQTGIQPGTAETCEGIIDPVEFEECAAQFDAPPETQPTEPVAPTPAPVEPMTAATPSAALPDTGGPSLALLAGILLVGAGLTMRRR